MEIAIHTFLFYLFIFHQSKVLKKIHVLVISHAKFYTKFFIKNHKKKNSFSAAKDALKNAIINPFKCLGKKVSKLKSDNN